MEVKTLDTDTIRAAGFAIWRTGKTADATGDVGLGEVEAVGALEAGVWGVGTGFAGFRTGEVGGRTSCAVKDVPSLALFTHCIRVTALAVRRTHKAAHSTSSVWQRKVEALSTLSTVTRCFGTGLT